MISFTINSVAVYPEIGFTIGVDKTDKFDFGDIELKNTTKSTSYVFGDAVEVTIGSDTRKYIVESDRKKQITETLYDHLITLTEEGAKLTKEIHTDRFFTVKSDGDNYTLKDMTEIIRDTEPFAKDAVFSIAAGTSTALNIGATELKLQQMNTWAKIVKVFKGIKASPRLLDTGSLTHEFYNSKGSAITVEHLLGSNVDLKANDYGNTLITKGRNLVYEGTVTFGTTVTPLERGVWFPTSDSGITVRASKGDYADDNAEYQLPMAIRKFYQVRIMNLSTVTLGTLVADITKYVVSKEQYDKLEVGTNTLILDDVYQRNALYFTKGDNKVVNMAVTHYTTGGVVDTMNALVRSWLEELATGAGLTEYVSQDINEYELCFFMQPYVDADISREKLDDSVSKRAMILSNQKESVVELQRYAGVMSDSIRKLANGNWLIHKLHSAWGNIWDVSDYTADDYQVIRASYVVYSETNIEGFYEMAQKWATIDGTQSTNREPQPYTMGKETSKANFRYTEYIELSTTQRSTTGGMTAQGFKTLLNLFDYDIADNIPIVLAQYINADSNQGALAINVATFPSASDGGINLFTGFLEPLLAGNQLDTSGNDELVPIRYTDDGGGVEFASFRFINDMTITPNDHPLSTYQTTTLYELNNKEYDLDPNEILGLNVELLWASDEDGIGICNRMNEYCNLILEYSVAQDTNLAIYVSDATVQYNEMNTHITDYNTKTVNTVTQIVVGKVQRYIDVTAVTDTDTKTWAIGFAVDDSLIMYVNYDGTDRSKIYFNNLKEKTNIDSL
jgi:hypothetical protein